MTSKYLVTGSMGFLGRNFLDRLPNATRLDRHQRAPLNITYDHIVSAGAMAQVADAINAPKYTTETTVGAVTQVVNISLREPRPKSIVHISSAEVYGPGKHLPYDRFRPRNPYAAAKAAQDIIMAGAHCQYDLPISIVVTQNIFGPYQQENKFIPVVVKRLLEGDKVQVVAGMRAWTYAPNLVDAVLFLGEQPYTHLPTDDVPRYHVTDTTAISNTDLVGTIASILGVTANIEHVEPSRTGHEFWYELLGTSQIRRMGWERPVEFDVALERTVRSLESTFSSQPA